MAYTPQNARSYLRIFEPLFRRFVKEDTIPFQGAGELGKQAVATCKLEGNMDTYVRRTGYKETRTGGARIVLKDTCKDTLTLAKKTVFNIVKHNHTS